MYLQLKKKFTSKKPDIQLGPFLDIAICMSTDTVEIVVSKNDNKSEVIAWKEAAYEGWSYNNDSYTWALIVQSPLKRQRSLNYQFT